MAKATWRLAARQIGPSGQCGASSAPWVSAYDAIRRSSEIPPACEMSGCTTATPAASGATNSERWYSRSPSAIGTAELCTTSASRP